MTQNLCSHTPNVCLCGETGIVEPVRTGVEDGVRLGLGKQEQDDFYTASENVQRKRLETEIQATEDEARRERREVGARSAMALWFTGYHNLLPVGGLRRVSWASWVNICLSHAGCFVTAALPCILFT